eukprot:scaffold24698_cov63-Phaeocystis_antarctica.AAC.12
MLSLSGWALPHASTPIPPQHAKPLPPRLPPSPPLVAGGTRAAGAGQLAGHAYCCPVKNLPLARTRPGPRSTGPGACRPVSSPPTPAARKPGPLRPRGHQCRTPLPS